MTASSRTSSPPSRSLSDGADELQRTLVGEEEPEGPHDLGVLIHGVGGAHRSHVQTARWIATDGDERDVLRDADRTEMLDIGALVDDHMRGPPQAVTGIAEGQHSVVDR